MNVVLSPDPTLRQVCQACEVGDKSLKKLAKQMAQVMYKNNGCGLAAPQVGVLKRLVVIDCGDQEAEGKNPIYLINPVVVETRGDKVVEEEGCLSCPGIAVPVGRAPWARVEFSDLEGRACFIEGDGLLGRCLQHEADHLDGKTLFEACDPLARIEALRAYDAACAAGAKPGETSVGARVR
ncbi:MAG: peptide deformylase [Raoultibacter sp.]